MKIVGTNITGSVSVNGNDVTTNIQTLNIWSGSVAGNIVSLNAYTASQNSSNGTYATTASLNAYTASQNASNSTYATTASLNLLTASVNSFTASQNVLNGTLATTGSNNFVGTQYISNTTQATTFTATASLYTDGGLRVTKDAYISGSTYVAGNLVVFGTSSIQYVTSSALVGLEYIDLNTDLPALRYAGIRVYDSGSNAGVTGSLFWDSQNNRWIYSNPSGSSYSGGMLISGPRASSLGSEEGTTNNALMKGQGGDHITSSAILDDGTSLRIPYLTIVTGTVGATTFSGSGANLTSIPNSALSNSTISGISLGSNLATLTIGTGLSGTSYNGSTGVTIANTGVTSITAGTGISINQGTGGVTITNTITNTNQLTNGAGFITSAGNAATATSATSATYLNSSNYIVRASTAGNLNTDFQNTPAGAYRYNGDDAGVTNSPGGSWWMYQNMRHSNASNYWGVQVAWGWEDNANRLATRNVTANSFGGWVYYLNSSNVTSYMDAPNKAGTSYYQANTWIQFNGNYGLYWPNNYGGHFYPNDGSSYTQFRINGSKNGYGGIWDSYSAVAGIMYDSGGNGGVYREANGRWYFYHHVGNNCMAIADSGTSSSYRLYVHGAIYATSDIVAYSDKRKKTNIATIDNALDKVLKLRGVYYDKIDELNKGRQTGVIAQEINEVLPEVVTYAKDIDEYGVTYGNIVGVLIEAIKEQQAQIEELKAKLG